MADPAHRKSQTNSMSAPGMSEKRPPPPLLTADAATLTLHASTRHGCSPGPKDCRPIRLGGPGGWGPFRIDDPGWAINGGRLVELPECAACVQAAGVVDGE